ncbi:MAG: YCF48-related protein [Ignavibacteriae bacterium]|nr:YCF48-related protein [Ignavibacteriota bacterium]
MKKLFTVFFLFFILNSSFFIHNCMCQWIQQSTGTTMDLSNIMFINRYTGWACGGGGILKTTNSGNNWITLNLPVNKPLQKIFPVDSNIIYCVGKFETIIKSTDGGANWQVIRDGIFGASNSYYCCYFINQNTGWITGGSERKILRTTNGCVTFDSTITYTSGFINDIYFKDSLSGLYCDNNGAVRKSTNGGFNWFSINIPVGTFSYDFDNFSFVNNQIGWLITYSGKVFRTNDFGSNWDSISSIQNSGYPLYSIFFANINIGYSGGAGYYLYRSTNGGLNWVQQYLPFPLNGATSIFFVNDTIGWKAANSGRICYTTNGGQLMQIINYVPITLNDFELKQNYPNPFNPSTTIL